MGLFSRSIRHRTFGKLKPYREGRFWRGRVPFGPAAGPVWVAIKGAAGPTDHLERLYLQLASRFDAMLHQALGALHGEYQRVRGLCPAARRRLPEAHRPADLLRLTPLDKIWLEDGGGHSFVLSFQSRAHKEQDFHVFFKDWKLENVAAEV